MRLVVFGPGYSAMVAIRRLHRRAEWIAATARSAERLDELEGMSVRALPFDGSARSKPVAIALADATHLLISIPPNDDGDAVLKHHRADITNAPQLHSIVYLSTVGVYGDHGGARVDETTEPRPRSARSKARLAAEKAWQGMAAETGAPAAILRLAGIYGPGRNALANLARGTARRVVKPGQMFNRIHVDDVAKAIDAALSREASGLFNVADDRPAPPQKVVAYAAELMGVAPPQEVPFVVADLSALARSFYGENKRVRNNRLKQELGVALAYPSYREGLSALWTASAGRP